MLKKWTNPYVWRNWWKPPHLTWWYFPSGSPPIPPPWYYYLKCPLIAHTIGVGIPVLIAAPFCSDLGAWLIGVGVVFKGQLQKADALFPRGYNVRNVLYRTVIAAVVGAVILAIGSGIVA
jgi:hypothetical protein